MDDIGLYNQIVMHEFCRVSVIGVNSPHLCRGKYDVVRFFSGEKNLHCGLITQFEFGMRTQQQIVIPATFQLTNQSRADQTAMPGYINFCIFIHVLLVIFGYDVAVLFHQLITLSALEVFAHHLCDQVIETDFGCPAEFVFGFAGIA